jgi:hypothetical protein
MPSVPLDTTFAAVEDNSLPRAASRLVITQILQWVIEPVPTWAWLIVGVYYGFDARPIWSQEVFVAHLGVDLASDSETASVSDGATAVDSEGETSNPLSRRVRDTQQGTYL